MHTQRYDEALTSSFLSSGRPGKRRWWRRRRRRRRRRRGSDIGKLAFTVTSADSSGRA
jgi:hypothetical protein